MQQRNGGDRDDGDEDASSSADYSAFEDSDARPAAAGMARSSSNNADTFDTSRVRSTNPNQSFSSVYRSGFSNPTSPSAASSSSSRPIYQRPASLGSNAASPPHFFGSSALSVAAAGGASSPLSTSATSSSSYLVRTGSRTNSSLLATTTANGGDDDDDDDLLEEKDRNIPMMALSIPSANGGGGGSERLLGASLPKSTSFGSGFLSKSAEESKASFLPAPALSSSSSANASPNTTPPYKPTVTGQEEPDDHLDLDALEDEEATLLASGPLLKDYHSSTSSIRKDYTTVDWYFTKANLGRIRRMIRLTNRAKGWKGRAMNAFIAAQGWIILFFVGVLTAASASFIHLVAEWLIDIKEGYCAAHGFFTTKRVCCMVADDCGWKTWGDGFDESGAFWSVRILAH